MRRTGLAIAGLLALGATGCSDTTSAPTPGSTSSATSDPPTTAPSTPSSPSSPPTAAPSTPPTTLPPANAPITLRIPSIKSKTLRVVAYNGTPDDVPGDRIQDKGRLASPRGAKGGTGPGRVGNFIVTGHRTEAGRPFGKLPSVRNGDHVLVTTGGMVYDYVITGTLSVSFRKPESKAAQIAPVPGRPGVRATRPMITLSTCATPEDHARGNYWKDALGNPEHRIDKIGVLAAVRPA